MSVTPSCGRVQEILPTSIRFGCFLRIILIILAEFSFANTHAATIPVIDFEAVDALGVSTWNGQHPVQITGVLLNNPDEMLDPTPNFIPWDSGVGSFQLGGEWQVFVQTIDRQDRGGVECWMGQNYGNLPWLHNSDLSYGNSAWLAEVNRIEHDPATGHHFVKGDLVTVTAQGSLFYGGMQNINEEHSTERDRDFTITLVSTNVTLPEPEVISLASVVNPDDGNEFSHADIFDRTRATGGEHWQGMRVRINGISLVETNGWNPALNWEARKCTVQDGEGRSFTIVHPRYSLGMVPPSRFDAIGILLQESGSGTDGTFGYELFLQELINSSGPLLNVNIQSNSIVVSWPRSLANYVLETTNNLQKGNWTQITSLPSEVDAVSQIEMPVISPYSFFRLRRVR